MASINLFYSKRRRGDRLFPSGHNIGYTSLRAIPPSPLTLESNTSKGLPHPLNTTNQEIVYNSMRALPHPRWPSSQILFGGSYLKPPLRTTIHPRTAVSTMAATNIKLEAINH